MWNPVSTFMWTPDSLPGFIWKPASTLKPNTDFQLRNELKTGVGFQCRRRFPNAWLSGNQRRVIIRTPASELITVWNTACSIFWNIRFHHILGTSVQYFMDVGFQSCSNFETGVHKVLDADFHNIFNLETRIQKILYASCQNIFNWKPASNMH